MGIESIIARDTFDVFRRIYMKRRESTGEYESTWQLIPAKYILNFGTIDYGVDDIKANHFKYNGFSFRVDNTSGYFSNVDEEKSFFYQKLTRNRTLVKVQAGYIDTDGTEYPTDPTLFVGLLNNNTTYKYDATIDINVDHLSSVFGEFPAADVVGLGATQTASDIISKIKGHTDGSNTLIFQKYITSGGWNISTTTYNYNMATSTSLQNINCWEFMRKLAESENRLLYISRLGDFYFVDKNLSGADTYHFSGVGDADKSYGINVFADSMNVKDNIDQVYNRIRIKIAENETDTSYYTYKETWTWGDSSSSFYYGVRTYSYDNTWINTATAQNIATTIFNEYRYPKQIITFDSKFVPHVNVGDNASLTYVTKTYTPGAVEWGNFLWGKVIWGERSGYNINIDNQSYKILNIKHDLNNFKSTIIMREYS